MKTDYLEQARKVKNIIPDVIKEALRVPEDISVSEWADRSRILNAITSAEPGRWNTSRTPYLQGVMDAFSDPYVEEITVMAASQVGKTEAMYNMLGYLIDQDPGPTLMVLPRADDAKSVSQNRVLPMLESSPALRRHLPSLSDDITKLEYHLDRMILYFAGSNSPADLASRPIRYLFLDEVDKYPRFSGREADPIKLASERQKTFWNKKTVKVSTPTTNEGYIYREYERSDKRKFYIPCPHCSKYQILVFAQIKWPSDEKDVEKIKTERLAWYECCHCGKRIEDYQKNHILTRGKWVSNYAEIDQFGNITGDNMKSRHKGFWINSLYSPWLTWSDIAFEFLRSKNFIELLMNFVNSWLAEPWINKAHETMPEFIKQKTCFYPEGLVPDGVMVLTAGVDVQKDHFYLVIRGWGVGEESWLIRACRAESWDDVISILFKTGYKRVSTGEIFNVRLACIDSGYRTDEVYDVCRRWIHLAKPVKGNEHLPVPYRISHIDRNPKGGTLKSGLALYHIDVSHYKDKINRMVHAEPGDPSQWHLFEHPSDEYITQFCSERKIIEINKKTGRSHEEWRLIQQGASNHYLDAEVYAVAGADILKVWQLRKDENESGNIYIPQPKRKDSSWDLMINNQQKWL